MSPRIDFLAVLAIDASDASVDALLPHFERAAKEQDRGLDRLKMLKKYASPTPAMTAMLARVDAMLGAREAASPALAVAERIGLGAQTTFWFHTRFGSEQPNRQGVPLFQCNVRIDSRKADWMECRLSEVQDGDRVRHTSFTATKLEEDTFGLGRCDAEDLPRWLAAAATKLGFTWGPPSDPWTSLRGKKRDHLVAWLTGGK